MLLKKKKGKVTAGSVTQDSGISSQGSSQSNSQPTNVVNKAFRNPCPAFRVPRYENQAVVLRPEPSPKTKQKLRSPVKRTPSPRAKPVPRSLVSPNKAGQRQGKSGKLSGDEKKIVLSTGTRRGGVGNAMKEVWPGGDVDISLRDFEDSGSGDGPCIDGNRSGMEIRDSQSSQQSKEGLSQRSGRVDLVCLRDFEDSGGSDDVHHVTSTPTTKTGRPVTGKAAAKKRKKKNDDNCGLDDLLNTNSISATADEILDSNADISEFCEGLGNTDDFCALVGAESYPEERGQLSDKQKSKTARTKGQASSSMKDADIVKTKRRRRLLCLESDSEVNESENESFSYCPSADNEGRKRKEKAKARDKKSRPTGAKTSLPKRKTKKALKKIKEERDVFTFRFYSTWVECVRCQKWRLLNDIYDPSTLPRRWNCTMQDDSDASQRGCSAPEIAWADDVDDHSIYTDFCEGSLVWARVPGFPWWPAMVDRDPDNDVYMWLKETYAWSYVDEDEPPEVGWYHVTFLDEDVSRSWISSRNIKRFVGVVDMEDLRMYGLSPDYEKMIEKTCRVAEKAISLDLTTRIKSFGFAFRWEGVQNRWTRYQKSSVLKSKTSGRKKKRKSLDMELAEAAANTEALTERADAIMDELERGILSRRRSI